MDKLLEKPQFYSPNNIEAKQSSNYQRKHQKKRSRSFVMIKTSMFLKPKSSPSPKNIKKPLLLPNINTTKPRHILPPMIQKGKDINLPEFLQICQKNLVTKTHNIAKKKII